ncbi:MAG: 2-succinyl-5-enolpyruvyl-6-hydroxy-3-cyclohexene-1-carboxylic-acid synthase, partial [Actinomycetota bacterium]|nr:2-succinyl-5-enolpyruvyl-6-hydroxy-3-cyclohexene-1-carboxylic-acid synthase [Actinomycetota bacterium]
MTDPYASTGAFFAELVAQGVTDVLVSPGSRSTPLAISAHATSGLKVSIHLDERSAAFWALGLSKASGRPVALVCTSGTAAANYLPAVVEAHYSEVPLLILTADRPPELRDRGAGQTIDQLAIYGSHVRWWTDLPVAGDADAAWLQSTAARAVRQATGLRPGPVHLNWPLREPLEPRVGAPHLPPAPALRITAPSSTPTADSIELLDEIADIERGLVLAGPQHDQRDLDAVFAFCRRTGWPLVAEPLSQLRHMADGVVVMSHHDHLLRTAWADQHRPDVVMRIGQPMTCKPLRLWLERHRPRHVLLDAGGSWTDASSTVTDMVTAGPGALAEVRGGLGHTSWSDAWREPDQRAIAVVDRILDAEQLME